MEPKPMHRPSDKFTLARRQRLARKEQRQRTRELLEILTAVLVITIGAFAPALIVALLGA